MPTFHSHSSGTLLEEPSRRKRSYHDFLHSESRTASPSSSPPPPPPPPPQPPRLRFSITPSPSNLLNMSRVSPVPPPRRYVGDGFGYRRPVMSASRMQRAARTPTPTPDVIDLTSDYDHPRPRPVIRRASVERSVPRLHHPTRRHHDQPGQRRQDGRPTTATQAPRAPVIDLESLDFGNLAPPPPSDEPLMVSNDDFLAFFQEPPSSPGFEILGERSVGPDPPRRSVAERRPTPYVSEEEHDPSEAPPLPQPLFRNLPHGLASWIVQAGSRITGGNTAGRVERDVPHEGSADRYTYANGVYAPVPQHNPGSGWQIQAQFHLPRLPALDAFQRPRLNYEAQGFELIGAAHASPPPRSSSPYKPPRASAQGFTRKVEEDEIVVCPHCGDELGTGDDDLKQQIWVVKQCGHVYCGGCALNRHVGKSKKMAPQAEGKPEPFKTCVVVDCKKPVTSKAALFQVYL